MNIIHTFVSLIESSKYILFFLGSYVEGSVVMMTGGLLYHLGEVRIVPLFIALYAGDLLSDITLYCVGYFGARKVVTRWGHLIKLTPAIVEKIERRFKRYHTWILIISKLTMGFGFAYGTLIVAGILKVSFPRYLIINALGGLIWIHFIITVGYFFGNIFEKISPEFRIIFVCGLLAAILLVFRYAGKRLAELS